MLRRVIRGPCSEIRPTTLQELLGGGEGELGEQLKPERGSVDTAETSSSHDLEFTSTIRTSIKGICWSHRCLSPFCVDINRSEMMGAV